MTFLQDDRKYWEQMRQGDQRALFELYHLMYFHLIRFGLKVCSDDELVKDCVNQLFLNLWDKRAALPPVEQVKSYLMTSLKHNILDQLSDLDKTNAALLNMVLCWEHHAANSWTCNLPTPLMTARLFRPYRT